MQTNEHFRVWKAGDSPEQLWELIHFAMDRGVTLIVKPSAVCRLTKTPMDATQALVLNGDLAFWPESISVETRSLITILSSLTRAQQDSNTQLMHEIAAYLGLSE